MSFFDDLFTADPQRAAALAGLAQGFGQAGMASRLPMGFGSVLAMGAAGMQQGQADYLNQLMERQKLQSGDIANQEGAINLQALKSRLAAQQQLAGASPQPSGATTTPMGFPATRMDAIAGASPTGDLEQGAANLGTNPAGSTPPQQPQQASSPMGPPQAQQPTGFDSIPQNVRTQMNIAGVFGGPAASAKVYSDWATEQNKIFDQRQGNRLTTGAGQIIGSQAPALPKDQSRTLTPIELQQYGLPAGTAAQIDSATGKVNVLNKPPTPAIPLPKDVEAQRIRIAKAGIDERANVQNAPVDTTPEQRASYAAQAATGMPLNQILPGYRGNIVAQRQQIHADAVAKIMTENPGMSAADAGTELANRTIEFQSGKKTSGQLTMMLGATRQAVAQLHFNIDKTKEEMAKLGSSDISPIINAIARGEEKWTGNPAYSSLFYFMHATAVESARVLSGGQASTAQLHQGAMEEASKWANVNMTPASFNAVGDAMKAEGENKLQTYQDALRSQRVGGGGPAATPAPMKGWSNFRSTP